MKRKAPLSGSPENGNLNKMKTIDLSYLKKTTKLKPSLMMEIISLYLKQTPPLVSAMKQSSKNKDWDSLQAAVHKMIPSFSIVGISKDIENVARKLQDNARTKQSTEGIPDMVTLLENVCVQACQELEEEHDIIKKTMQ